MAVVWGLMGVILINDRISDRCLIFGFLAVARYSLKILLFI
jgi:hypothetical protein